MAENSKIEWTDATINFWIGCTKVSAACDNCYAESLSTAKGWAKWGHGEPRYVTKNAVATAFKLDRKAAKEGRPLFVFTNSLADMFDAEVPDEWRDRAFAVMALTPHLIWLVLTKRPKVMHRYITDMSVARADGRGEAFIHIMREHRPGEEIILEGHRWPLRNVWLGCAGVDAFDNISAQGSGLSLRWQRWIVPDGKRGNDWPKISGHELVRPN